MAGKQQVVLTFAGDSSNLEKAFEKVGDSSKRMSADVGSSSRSIKADTTDAFDRAGEGADNAEGKAQGFASTLTGTKDTAAGLGEIMRGNTFEGFVMVGQGAADLAEGLNYTVIPAAKAAATAFTRQGIASTRAAVATGRHRVASLVATAATWAQTVAQRALNFAMKANPLLRIVTLLFLVGGALVAAYRKSSTFRAVVQGAMRGVQRAFGWVLARGRTLLSWFRSAPGQIGRAFGRLGGIIIAPFRAAFGQIKRLWNSTAGGFGFSIPGWVPKIGGNSFRIPRMHTGGIMGGAPGTEGLALLQAGERVTPAGASGASTVIEIRSGGTRMDDLLVELLSRAIRVRGGNVQVVLGSG